MERHNYINDPNNALACMRLIREFNAKDHGMAEFSECKTYRYILYRNNPTPLRWVRPILFIMLNPSTADAFKLDPTVRRCVNFTKKWGGTTLTVVNLFALRSTDPKKLLTHPDPIGPLNDAFIEDEIRKHQYGIIVAAWGAHPSAQERGSELLKKFGPFKCLGETKMVAQDILFMLG